MRQSMIIIMVHACFPFSVTSSLYLLYFPKPKFISHYNLQYAMYIDVLDFDTTTKQLSP